MRITQEADYAIRICAALAKTKGIVGAPSLSEELGIPSRFASKILRKLMLAGLVKSVRGVGGGFTLAKEPGDISLRSIIEAIDGAIAIRHCLLSEHVCSYQGNKSKCRFHSVFEELNGIIVSRLEMLTLSDMVDESIPIGEIVKRLHIMH